jgi:hypothetical protein
MTAKVPGSNVTLLTVTSKMPCHSFSLPAVRSCPMAWFGKNGICGESKEHTTCYATKGGYKMYPAVALAQEARYQWTIRASLDPIAGDEWVDTMIAAVRSETNRQRNAYQKEHGNLDAFQAYFRVHDSGDLFSPSYTQLWVRVCKALPDVKFWFPTRMWRTKNEHMKAALLLLNSMPHVSVRPSALRFDDAAPAIEGLAAGTTASEDGFNCPASLQKNACGDCRMCWTKDRVVSYHAH